MALIKINNHVGQAEDRLLQQYKESRVFNIFLNAIVAQVQVIEDQCDLLYRERSLLTAYGYQLDGIGKLIGLSRNGRDDEDYRDALISQIEINVSGGEPESIINAIRKILSPKSIDYFDIYPAYYQLFVQTDENANNLASLVQSMTPAGVGKAIVTLGTDNDPFVLVEATTADANFVMQSGNYHNQEISQLEVESTIGDVYDLVVETDAITDDLSGQGLAELTLNTANLNIGNGDIYEVGNNDLLELSLENANEDYTISDFGGELAEVII